MKDISSRFRFRTWTMGPYFYKEAAGELGVPGQVFTHRSTYAQQTLSGGTGEHAGHLIGIQFGAPGDIRNMGLQNPNMNTFAPKDLHEIFQGSGGSYHHLESQWSDLLKQGYRIDVTIVDKYRLKKDKSKEDRPFTRSVSWMETTPAGVKEKAQSLDFGNFSSPQSRDHEAG